VQTTPDCHPDFRSHHPTATMSAAAPDQPVEEENFQLVWHNHQSNFHEVDFVLLISNFTFLLFSIYNFFTFFCLGGW